MDLDDYIDNKLTHSLHTSERLSFRGCRRRWNWIFNDRYYPMTTAKPLEFGTAFHKAMETWYDPDFWTKDRETQLVLTRMAFINTCAEQKRAVPDITPEVDADYEERVELGIGMIDYHCKNVSPMLDTKFKPIRTEIEFEVPIRDENGQLLWCKCRNCWKQWMAVEARHPEMNDFRQWGPWKGLPVTYGGRIDCLVEDENGELWIVDWKTAARMSGQEEGDSPDEFILLDDQITSYCWALWVLGIRVAGFIHHEIKKAFPIEPEPNKTQRKGCWYSVNKQQNVTYELYRETVAEGDPSGLASGAYDEFLTYLKESGPRFYSRKQVHRNDEELRQAGLNILMEARDITDPNLRIYPSPGRFACSFCAFRQPCLAKNGGEDYEYLLESAFEKRERRYWEIAPPSTESRGGR